MFTNNPGSTKISVHGIDMYLPARPPLHAIAGYHLPKKEQKWIRTDYPEWWDEAFEEESEIRDDNEDYRDPRCEEFRAQEWDRRLNGYWFMNNGEPTYIVGIHYFFLNWIKLDVGYPKYYDFQRKNLYFTQYCIEDPFCLGYFKVGPRGFGKTMEEIAVQLELMTRPPHRSKGAIQSKSGNDAYKVFRKEVEIYNELPEFFKPESSHGTNPEKKLSFFRDKTRGKKAKKVKQDDDKELKNEVWWEVAKETALDGDTLRSVIQEEIGKSDPKEQVNVAKRVQVNRFCVYRNNIKRGIIQCTSTIEEMKEGGAEAYIVWKGSDFKIKSENGFTTTGLYRAFTSALDTTVIDEYGRSNQEQAKRIHESERKLRRDDPNELASYIRKNPFTADEAFTSDAEGCEFNAYVLTKRIEELRFKETTVVGDFEWTNGRDSRVRFVPNPTKGKWKVAWLPTKDEETNLVTEGPNVYKSDGTVIKTWRPGNDLKFRAGADPTDLGLEVVDAKRVSDAAFYIQRLFDMSVDTDPNLVYTEETCNGFEYKIGKPRLKTNIPIVQYICRNDDPLDTFEDCIKTIRFFGCSVLPEINKPGIRNHLISRGYGDFIKYRPKETFTNDSGAQYTQGITSSEPIIQQYLMLIKTYVNNYGHLIPFVELTQDLLNFRRKRIREHDPTVAFGFTQIALLGNPITPARMTEVTELFDTYKINGTTTELSR